MSDPLISFEIQKFVDTIKKFRKKKYHIEVIYSVHGNDSKLKGGFFSDRGTALRIAKKNKANVFCSVYGCKLICDKNGKSKVIMKESIGSFWIARYKGELNNGYN